MDACVALHAQCDEIAVWLTAPQIDTFVPFVMHNRRLAVIATLAHRIGSNHTLSSVFPDFGV